MAPLSFDAAEIVTLTGVVSSVSRTTAFVVQPDGAVFACTCMREIVLKTAVARTILCLAPPPQPSGNMNPADAGETRLTFHDLYGVVQILRFARLCTTVPICMIMYKNNDVYVFVQVKAGTNG